MLCLEANQVLHPELSSSFPRRSCLCSQLPQADWIMSGLHTAEASNRPNLSGNDNPHFTSTSQLPQLMQDTCITQREGSARPSGPDGDTLSGIWVGSAVTLDILKIVGILFTCIIRNGSVEHAGHQGEAEEFLMLPELQFGRVSIWLQLRTTSQAVTREERRTPLKPSTLPRFIFDKALANNPLSSERWPPCTTQRIWLFCLFWLNIGQLARSCSKPCFSLSVKLLSIKERWAVNLRSFAVALAIFSPALCSSVRDRRITACRRDCWCY